MVTHSQQSIPALDAPGPSAPFGESLVEKVVLLVDDDPISTEARKAILERKLGCKVTIAAGAWDAIVEMSRSNFDLLITDFHMPGINGFQLVLVVRAIWRLPIMMLTGDSAVPDYAREEVDEFIEKGLPPEIFIERVWGMLCRDIR